jgi:hypothetical protein
MFRAKPLDFGTHLWYTFIVHRDHKGLNLLEEIVRVERPPGSTTLQVFLEFLWCSTVQNVLSRKLVHNGGTHCRAFLEVSPGSTDEGGCSIGSTP